MSRCTYRLFLIAGLLGPVSACADHDHPHDAAAAHVHDAATADSRNGAATDDKHPHGEVGAHSHDEHAHDEAAPHSHDEREHDEAAAHSHDEREHDDGALHSHDAARADSRSGAATDDEHAHDESAAHSHDEREHDEAAAHSHDEREHDEAAAHSHDERAHDGEGEHPTVALTRWTDRSELFMEYPVFVAGRRGRSAIHVTDLSDFSPLSEGEVVVSLRGEDGKVFEFRGGPSRPGIFGLDLGVERAGVYSMSLAVDAPGLKDVHELGEVTVHASSAHLPHGEQEEGDAISFLKEQQWTLEFGTTVVARREIRPGITVPATVRPRPGGDALLSAPVPGRIDPSVEIPAPGMRVEAGSVLARIIPRSDDLMHAAGLRAALVDAEQAYLLAVQERDRAERLVEARALPRRRLDEAKARVVATEARLEAARESRSRFEAVSQSDGESGGFSTFALRAPFDGVVSEVRLTAGVSVDANEPLLRIVDPDRVHVVGAVPETLAPAPEELVAGELVLDGKPPLALGPPMALGPVIDPVSRTVEIRFALDNRGSRLRLGRALTLRMLVGEGLERTAVPESAVVDDGGRPVVFVQTGGESFERRPVRLGGKAGGHVHVVDGVEPGERVVDRGAYLVRLAAMSTQIPAHGHVH
jgi:RND family efflux transporter MFP subunit